MERAADCRVPPRALSLRALLCERERIANHLGDIGAICNDVGFAFAHVQCARLREHWQRRSASAVRPSLHDGRDRSGRGRPRPVARGAGHCLRADHAALRRAIEPPVRRDRRPSLAG